jgi:hypothetical protein
MLQPPVKLDDLMKEWSQDKVIDPTAMEKETLKISHLHGKYLNVRTYHHTLQRKLEIEYKSMKALREDYYHSYLTQEELEARGWDPIQQTLSNPQIARKLESDDELNKLLLRRELHESIVFYCDQVLKSLNSRTWDVGNFIKYRQMMDGK